MRERMGEAMGDVLGIRCMEREGVNRNGAWHPYENLEMSTVGRGIWQEL